MPFDIFSCVALNPPLTAWARAQKTFDLLGWAILYLFWVLATSYTGIITLYVLDLYGIHPLNYGSFYQVSHVP